MGEAATLLKDVPLSKLYQKAVGISIYSMTQTLLPPFKSKISSIRQMTHHELHHAVPKASSGYFNSKQLGSIYAINTTQPTSRVGIAVIELGGGVLAADLNTYWNYIGLTTKPIVTAISIDGATNNPGHNLGDDAEVTLDIEAIGGICPNSNIYVYFAPNTNQGFYDAISAAITSTSHPASIISISWGGPENEWGGTPTIQQFNTLLQSAANRGTTVCVAAGDSGASDGEQSGLHVDFPASSPYSLACGGTSLKCPDLTYDSKTTEVVWNNSTGATGGGYSSVFAKPSYQNAVSTIHSNFRSVPDVSADADPNTGCIVYLHGAYYVIGGTSVVAPLWSGYLGNLNSKVWVNPIIYSVTESNPSCFHDIVTGQNGGYSAGRGYDECTGWGTPNGSVLTPALVRNHV